MRNIFYFRSLNAIGGVESFLYYMVKRYKDWDITVYYKTGDATQINRIAQYADIRRFDGSKIRCNKAFFNYHTDILPYVIADEYIQIIHADYQAQRKSFEIDPGITRYIGVSKSACKSFKELTGKDIELCYNPVIIERFDSNPLRLVSATRLTKEKGKDRIIKLSKMLDNAGINYIWTIFTNDKKEFYSDNVIFVSPKMGIQRFIKDSDYLVQLSSSETYCYSVVEALSLGTPVIVTDCPVFREMGVIDGENGFILDFELNNVPISKIVENKLKFKYKIPQDGWNGILEPGSSEYKRDNVEKVLIRPIKRYFDIQIGKWVDKNTPPFNTDRIRADILISSGVCGKIER